LDLFFIVFKTIEELRAIAESAGNDVMPYRRRKTMDLTPPAGKWRSSLMLG